MMGYQMKTQKTQGTNTIANNNVKSIYLAGKVNPHHDWREGIIPRKVLFGSRAQIQVGDRTLMYEGPFLEEDWNHGYACATHGVTDESLDFVHSSCLEGIESSDVVFAWIDDTTAYGTFSEIGYAKALKKTIWIASPYNRFSEMEYASTGDLPGENGNYGDELWFIYKFADELFINRGMEPLDAIRHFLRYQFESPIEQMFWDAWKDCQKHVSLDFCLEPQYQVGKYYLDFAYVPEKFAIELDGHATHSSPDAIAYDRKRQREIESAGWRVVRFGGKEITSNAYQCALEVYSLLLSYKDSNTQTELKSKIDTQLIQIQKKQEDNAQNAQQQSSVPPLPDWDDVSFDWQS